MKLFFLGAFIFLLTSTPKNADNFIISDVSFVKGVYQLDGKNLTGHIVDYYENDQLKFRYTVLDGRLHGAAWEYYPTGSVKAERTYIFGKLYGDYTIYYPSGESWLEMEVKDNAYEGGEKAEAIKISSKAGKKLKDKGEGRIIFFDSNGEALDRSEDLAIQQQFSFKVVQGEKTLYNNK